jgi:hypothetical protein
VVNNAPVAVAIVPPGAIIGESIVLDGTRSTDPEGKSLTYAWELTGAPTGSAAQLSNTKTALSVFVPDVVGVYQFRLNVSDGVLTSTSAEGSLTVRRANMAPVAVARTVASSVLVGQVVTLDASGSYDDDRDLITYDWAMITRPADSVTLLTGVSSPQPAFLADKPGRYVFSLIVNDGRLSSKAATIAVDAGVKNMPPVANVADVEPVLTGSTVILNGAGSKDPNNDNIRFTWTFASTPGTSAPAISGANTVRPSFAPQVEGDYLVKLVVDDGELSSEPAFVRVSVAKANQRPTAIILASSNVTLGETVVLDGARSTDPNVDPLTYFWSIISKPQGSAGNLQGVRSPKATLEADKPGQYVVGLTVNDGTLDSFVATHIITAKTGNRPPVAQATTLTPSVKVGSDVLLSAASSSDPDASDLITYEWTLISIPVGSLAKLDNKLSVAPRFVPDREGQYLLGLTVRDNSLTPSSPVTLLVEASATNGRPVARVVPTTPVVAGTMVILDASKSDDPDPGDLVTYEWKLLARPPGSSSSLDLQVKNAVWSTLTPDVEGDYIVQLVVIDSKGLRSDPAVIKQTATRPAANRPPKATIQTATPSALTGATVVLDGAASLDPEVSMLSYQWSLISAPSGSSRTIQGAAENSPRITLLADKPGLYVVGLKVKDKAGLESELDTITITATASNRPPEARIDNLSATLAVGAEVVLSGERSLDPDLGNLIGYTWNLVSVPSLSGARLLNQGSAYTRFTPDRFGKYVVNLVVTDSNGASSQPYSVVVDVPAPTAENNRPVANAVALTPSVLVNALAVFDGSQSRDQDPNDRISYQWSLAALPPTSQLTPANALEGANSVRPTLKPDVEGDYLVQLVVTDSKGARSDPVITRVTAVRPTVNQPPSAIITSATPEVTVGATAVLEGSGSSDPERSALTYEWILVSQPLGSSSTPPTVPRLQSNPTSPRATLTTDMAGTYVVGLKVRDPAGLESSAATYTVVASSTPRDWAGVRVLPVSSGAVGQPLHLEVDPTSIPSNVSAASLNYAWSIVSAPIGASAVIGEPNTKRAVVIPDATGYWVFKLVVHQGVDALGNRINPTQPVVLVVRVN